jgi:acyl-CoA synthetase (AMP-forming)/AMP-acid ligase II
MYTCGTTGRAKGVLHTHNTLARVVTKQLEHWKTQPGQTLLAPYPVTHVTGLLNGLELPFFQASRCILMERCSADEVADIIEREGVAYTLCATPFIQELIGLAEREHRGLPGLRLFPCGGASVPPHLIYRIRQVLPNCRAFPVYGSTEAPLITQGYVGEGQESWRLRQMERSSITKSELSTQKGSRWRLALTARSLGVAPPLARQVRWQRLAFATAPCWKKFARQRRATQQIDGSGIDPGDAAYAATGLG